MIIKTSTGVLLHGTLAKDPEIRNAGQKQVLKFDIKAHSVKNAAGNWEGLYVQVNVWHGLEQWDGMLQKGDYVTVYARELKAGDEQLYRALTLSNLTTIHEKTPIGRLSAYCGAISAGAGAGAGIAYLCGGGYEAVIHTVVNALAVVSGVICDGAKASCAAKIATAVEAGLLGYNMYIRGQQFRGGDGIVAKGVENSLRNVGRLGKQGMKETNREIIDIMVGCK